MRNDEERSVPKKRYEAPSVTEVYVDPHKELLQSTNCGLGQSDPRQTCVNNPFI